MEIKQPSDIGIAIENAGPITMYAGFLSCLLGGGGASISTSSVYNTGRFLGALLKYEISASGLTDAGSGV